MELNNLFPWKVQYYNKIKKLTKSGIVQFGFPRGSYITRTIVKRLKSRYQVKNRNNITEDIKS